MIARRRQRAGSRRLRVCVSLCAGLTGTGCAGLPPAGAHSMRVIPAGTAVAPATPERSFFSIALVAADETATTAGGKPFGSATISVRRDNVLVYGIQIPNASGETYTQAQVVRKEPDGGVDVIATLFSDVMMRGTRISVRGTASLSRTLPPDALLAQVREHPDQYQIVVRGERHPSGTLTGSLGSR